jgi:hypothetical protein
MAGDSHRARNVAIASLIIGGITTIVLAIVKATSSSSGNSGGSVGGAEAKTVAIITGFAGIVVAVGGVMLALRQVRTREREAVKGDLDRVERDLEEERDARLTAERNVYKCVLLLAQSGIEPPEGVVMRRSRPRPDEEPDEELPEP